ncbi:molybdopterin-dependent oxidoreductase [Mesorhizobium sp. RP14(2022)]|uniref:Molybdopterin-dependent oxidoreductase n=1 Tax=Mesorhizobium liriopis TaxID=2953882 RepID=A0ABT1C090_9HYPH|nr:molybdopterin cofactor-binding domain-containing protein [Mesorhizobium liriopis]MCO6048258.1 molybdopterin-dependent oxidoreductase [Mesorhizobium liriopis]
MNALSRRGLLKGAGALVVSFSMSRAFAQEGEVAGGAPKEAVPELPGALAQSPFLDSWIRIEADGSIKVFTGKAELGQGVKTAILQVAAEELEVEPRAIEMITADTGQTPNEGYTAGSQSMPNSATAVRNAAAQARALLIGQAAGRWSLDPATLRAENGSVIAPNGETLSYGALVSSTLLHVEAQPQSPLKAPDQLRQIGQSMQRIDIPGKVTGGEAYVQDMRMTGMVHARVVRPPSYGAQLQAVDTAGVDAMPGVVGVVRDGDFLAVVADKEFRAIKAMRMLAKAAQWSESETLPDSSALPDFLRQLPREDGTVASEGTPVPSAHTYEASFTRPYQAHGSIGPSCAVALWEDERMTVWSHTQGVYPDQKAIGEMLELGPDRLRVVHREGSGCYGHNGADDAAADAALIAQRFPGRPVRVQWMREQEHGWEPLGPAMVTQVRAGIDASGQISEWNYELWSNTHSTRPGPAGALLAGRHSAKRFAPEEPELEITKSGNGDRNSVPLYVSPSKQVVWHFLKDMPLRVSALRGLGAYANVFSIESTMDELALLAKTDPVAFRLKHLEDLRAKAVVEEAATRFGWSNEPLPQNTGRGFGFARYKNFAAYCAIALEAEIDPISGRVQVKRVVSAIDSGQAVNPDGIRNQTEGGILQSLSWTLFEAVPFDRTRVTGIDWSTYPILRFSGVPASVEVHVIDRPGEPFLGSGEAAQGPMAGAIANAIRHATGLRLTDLPFSRERVRAALMQAAGTELTQNG